MGVSFACVPVLAAIRESLGPRSANLNFRKRFPIFISLRNLTYTARIFDKQSARRGRRINRLAVDSCL